MFTSAVGKKHFATKTCRTQAARVMERERVARQALEANDIVFYVDNVSIETVSEYKYLGRILSADDRDEAAVSYNIKKASNAWFGMYRILSADGADALTMARFYLAVVQAKLLFGSETWVLSRRISGPWNDFMLVVLVTSRHIRPLPDSTWLYPPTNEVLDQCGLSPFTHILQNAKQHCSTIMPSLRAVCIDNALRPLQLGVALIARCGGISITTNEVVR